MYFISHFISLLDSSYSTITIIQKTLENEPVDFEFSILTCNLLVYNLMFYYVIVKWFGSLHLVWKIKLL